jgi:transposase
MEVRTVEFTASTVGDAPMLPGLLSQILKGEQIASVIADGAYDGPACRDAIATRGAEAIIPPCRNAKSWKEDSPGARGRNDDLRAMKRFGRTLLRKWSGYHRRSRVETEMNCLELLGQKLLSRNFDHQTSELQVRIAILNRFTALGIPVTRPAA